MTGQNNERSSQTSQRGTKKEYVKPAFEFEQVFETMALACGKIRGTQGACHAIRKNS